MIEVRFQIPYEHLPFSSFTASESIPDDFEIFKSRIDKPLSTYRKASEAIYRGEASVKRAFLNMQSVHPEILIITEKKPIASWLRPRMLLVGKEDTEIAT